MPPYSVASASGQLLRRIVREAKSEHERGGAEKSAGKAALHSTAGPIVTTESTLVKFQHSGEKILEKVAEKSHIPFWGVLLILLVIVLVILAAFYFCLAKWWRKFRESDKGQGFKGLDLKSVNLIGQMGKEKVNDCLYFICNQPLLTTRARCNRRRTI